MAAGFASYLIGVDEHLNALTTMHALKLLNPGGKARGILWSETVKEYLIGHSYIRPATEPDPPNEANMIWNGEIPINYEGDPVCAGGRKRGECPPPNSQQASASSISSAASASSAATQTPNPTITASATQPTHTPSGPLPILTKVCSSSTLLGCQWIHFSVSQCPTNTLESLPASCHGGAASTTSCE